MGSAKYFNPQDEAEEEEERDVYDAMQEMTRCDPCVEGRHEGCTGECYCVWCPFYDEGGEG